MITSILSKLLKRAAAPFRRERVQPVPLGVTGPLCLQAYETAVDGVVEKELRLFNPRTLQILTRGGGMSIKLTPGQARALVWAINENFKKESRDAEISQETGSDRS